ncbi:MAG: hypothetical protein IT583_00215 [Verrucomicrobia bacterium]|nr:hypothetical protein [Verrucomicrobiota bacterium]
MFWFQEDENPKHAVCIVAADLIGFGPETTVFFRQLVLKKYGLPPERLLLTASHTHSGPHIESLVLGTGAMVPAVRDMVLKRIEDAMEQARLDMVPVSMEAGKGQCVGYAINRRLKSAVATGSLAPDPNGPRDDQVTAITCRNTETGKIKAVLFHFTCHPSTMGDYRVTADFPGAACRHVEKTLGGDATVAFMPGCAGDIRSYCTYMGAQVFRPALPRDITIYGEALGGEILRVISDSSQLVTPQLHAALTTVTLPLAPHPTRESLEKTRASGSAFEQEWAGRILSKPFSCSREFDIQRVDLAKEASIIAMAGEVCVEYGLFIKSLRPSAFMMPLGYSNSIIGYIPTAAMFPEGGYEPERSCPYFGLPAPFDPGIEEIIRKGIREIL